jgi:hypothetical protein
MEQLKPPGALNLEGNLAENFKEWIQSFEQRVAKCCLHGKKIDVQEKGGRVLSTSISEITLINILS